DRGDVRDFEAGDDALHVGLERDRGDIPQSGAVAEARCGEELGEKRLLAGWRAARERRGEQRRGERPRDAHYSAGGSGAVAGSSSSSFSTSRAIDTTLSSASMSMSRTPCRSEERRVGQDRRTERFAR